MARILIAGCGYIGCALGERLIEDGHQVWGLRRDTAQLPDGIQGIAADVTGPETLTRIPPFIDTVYYMASPDGRDDNAYRLAYLDGLINFIDALTKQRQEPKRFVFVSSTSVYGQSGGEWVNEESTTNPTSHAGERLLQGERVLVASGFPSLVVRFGGIYGPGRTRFLEQVRNGTVNYPPAESPRYSNRIHRDDCVGVLRHVMDVAEPRTHYIGVDLEPAPLHDVVAWLAERLGVSVPPPTDAEDEEATLHRGNKQCSNARLVASGYRFRYPTFREGYEELIQELST